ncbi:ATP-dependent protease subunit HslV [Candidatus Poribacteria bacterium]|nr:ATP-dependent protease subunit HslV [Candidatus Poribacteria bacterium]
MFHGTTILSVRHKGFVAIGGDGQVTFQDSVVKHSANKIRRIYKGKVILGFAGAVADAMSLYERLEGKLEKYSGNLVSAVGDLAKDWRLDRVLRKLDAMLVVVDAENSYLVSGTGDVLSSDDGIIAVGSGSNYALSAARALVRHSSLSASEIVKESLLIASEICIYTNDRIVVEEISPAGK